MATQWTEISTVTREKFLPTLVDNIFTSRPLLMKLNARSRKLDGGRKIVVPLNMAKTTAKGFYDGYDLLNTTPNDVVDAAEFDWRNFYVNVTIAEDDIDENMGTERVLDLVATKMDVAKNTASDTLADSTVGVLSGAGGATDSTGLDGLKVVCASATSTSYGGITSESWWVPNQDTTTTTMSMSALQGQYGNVSINNNQPDIIVSDQDNFDRYWNLLQPQQRFQSDAMARAGFRSLLLNGTPWVVDPHCGTADVWYLNTKFLFLAVHKKKNFVMSDFMKPVNQEVRVARVLWKGNLVCSNRRMQGRLSAITA
jgi:hypothetical protein